jgi:hypothetical protein
MVALSPFMAVFALVAYGQSCNCDDSLVQIPNPPGETVTCDPLVPCEKTNNVRRFDQCGPSGCETDADCCPGTRCRVDFNACWPKLLDGEFSCEDDSDCQDPAARCQDVTIGDRDPLAVCSYERCTSDLDCGADRLCYHSVCIGSAPCGGGCPDGEVCDVLTSTCNTVSSGAIGCDQECDGLRVLADPDVMRGEVCCATVCQCKGLPPLVPSRYGKYSRIALAGELPVVSTYDNEYGDLVVLYYEKDGALANIEYVDGVPTTGTVVADPTGPRGGISDPGPNVGTHTAIATDASGKIRIAYFDLDQRALKVAIQQESGWQTHVIDLPTENGTVGMFSDISVDETTGQITISYLAYDVVGAPGLSGPANGVKVAQSISANPSSTNDWQVSFVDVRENDDACDGACTATEACVLENNAPICLGVSTGCGSTCGDSETCVLASDASGSVCLPGPNLASSEQMPLARGLHTTLVQDEDDIYIAYYDSIDGDLRLAQWNSSSSTTTWVIDGDGTDGRLEGDLGRFPSIAKVGAEFQIVYTDFSRHQFRLWTGTPGTAGSRSVIDFGLEEELAGQRFVGAGASLVGIQDRGVVVYQDSTHLNLVWAEQNENGWDVVTLLGEGANGFYSDLVVTDTSAYIVSVLAELDSRGLEHPRVGLVIRGLPETQ